MLNKATHVVSSTAAGDARASLAVMNNRQTDCCQWATDCRQWARKRVVTEDRNSSHCLTRRTPRKCALPSIVNWDACCRVASGRTAAPVSRLNDTDNGAVACRTRDVGTDKTICFSWTCQQAGLSCTSFVTTTWQLDSLCAAIRAIWCQIY